MRVIAVPLIVALNFTGAFAQNIGGAADGGGGSFSPLFQGIVVDTKGRLVGRLSYIGTVIRQIDGTWVAITTDFVTGFIPNQVLFYNYQSSDCTGQPYMPTNSNCAFESCPAFLPADGIVATIPPATQPSIYYPETPGFRPMQSFKVIANPNVSYQLGVCYPLSNSGNPVPVFAGLPQSVLMSRLGLTPPFSIR
jgi:hypothetical protein